CIQSLEFPWTF
nr:immunoglobulin light chain junction region [Macaca mulatta]MOV74454.1 immunoglobulin light chain junction region [Macaca mulatta]MOV74457.1 immunoglobulin light chain junction region [Macaca mulatta]MOV74571.1 immunoglobulin light chain junction region [Macaca mulatta]MOV74784.1 immunoglobulin light chain junction region [Macaca mulatta]